MQKVYDFIDLFGKKIKIIQRVQQYINQTCIIVFYWRVQLYKYFSLKRYKNRLNIININMLETICFLSNFYECTVIVNGIKSLENTFFFFLTITYIRPIKRILNWNTSE